MWVPSFYYVKEQELGAPKTKMVGSKPDVDLAKQWKNFTLGVMQPFLSEPNIKVNELYCFWIREKRYRLMLSPIRRPQNVLIAREAATKHLMPINRNRQRNLITHFASILQVKLRE